MTTTTLRQTAGRHPLPAATLCAGLQFLLTIFILDAGKAFAPPAAWGQVKVAAFASTVILPLLLVQALGLWRAVGLGLERLRPPPFFYACLTPVLMFAALGVRLDARPDVGGEVLMQLVNAFGEELLFRGVIFALLLRLPVWQAIVANGLLFGAMHLIHGVMDGDWAHAAVWALMSACAGMMFTAARYRTGSLWLLVLLHMVLNLASIYSNVEFVAGPEVNLLVQRATKVVELALAAWVMVAPRASPDISPDSKAAEADVLQVQVFVDAVRRTLAADTAVLDAAECCHLGREPCGLDMFQHNVMPFTCERCRQAIRLHFRRLRHTFADHRHTGAHA